MALNYVDPDACRCRCHDDGVRITPLGVYESGTRDDSVVIGSIVIFFVTVVAGVLWLAGWH